MIPARFRRGWLLAAIAAMTFLRTATAAEPDTSRVLSVGGSITEVIYALGLDDRLIGVDTTSIYPARALADNPNVGYLRRLAPESILALEPTVILAEEDAGPPTTMDVLEASGIPTIRLVTAYSEAGVLEKIRRVAKLFGVAAAGEELAGQVHQDFVAARAAVAANAKRPRVLFILSMQGDRLLAAGDNTSAAAMIDLAGGENAVSGFEGYKLVNHEAVLEANPEVVVMMRSGEHQLTAGQVFANPALRGSSAARTDRFVVMDGLYLLGFGPRTGQAVRDLATAIAPVAKTAQ